MDSQQRQVVALLGILHKAVYLLADGVDNLFGTLLLLGAALKHGFHTILSKQLFLLVHRLRQTVGIKENGRAVI